MSTEILLYNLLPHYHFHTTRERERETYVMLIKLIHLNQNVSVYTDQFWIFTQLMIIISKIFKKTGKDTVLLKTKV